MSVEENIIGTESVAEDSSNTALRVVGWTSLALGAVALGLFVGRELRSRYKFNRRTPYDFYAAEGEQATEYGVGV